MKKVDEEQTARAMLALLPDVIRLEKMAASIRAQVTVVAKCYGIEPASESRGS